MNLTERSKRMGPNWMKLAMVVFLAGCIGEGSAGTGDGGGGPSGGTVCGTGFHSQSCSSNSDCYSGNCRSGTSCYLGQRCAVDADCLRFYPGMFTLRSDTERSPPGRIQWVKCFSGACAFYCDVIR